MLENMKKFVANNKPKLIKVGLTVVGAVIGMGVLLVVGKIQEEADFNDELTAKLSDAVIDEDPR